MLPIVRGVPQGSILGPLLFLLFVNDIVNSSTSLHFILYADDTNLFLSHKNIEELMLQANVEMQRVTKWFIANKLKVNKSKTKYMIFNLKDKHKSKQLLNDLDLKVDNEIVERVEYTNFLGVIIDNKLNWEKHIEGISKKVSANLGIIRKLRTLLPNKSLFTLYNSIIHPYLSYCNLVWGSTFDKYLMPLYILQKSAVRLCCNAHFRAHSSPLFKKLRLLKLHDMVAHNSLLFMFKFKYDLLPGAFHNYFCLNSAIHNTNTRGKDTFHLPLFRSSFIQQNSIKYRGAVQWNSLDSSILKCEKRYHIFKKIHKTELLETY